MMAHVGDRDPASDALDRRRPDRDEVTDRLLRTDRAYDVACDRLVSLLPGCRHRPLAPGCADLDMSRRQWTLGGGLRIATVALLVLADREHPHVEGVVHVVFPPPRDPQSVGREATVRVGLLAALSSQRRYPMTATIPQPLRIAGPTSPTFGLLGALHTAEVIRCPTRSLPRSSRPITSTDRPPESSSA